MYDDGSHTLYLDRFYKATREAIEQNAFADLVYGCFAGCMYVLRVGRPFQEIEIHAKGFRLSVDRFVANSVVDDEEMFLLECMWEKLLWYMAKTVVFRSSSTAEELSQIAEFAQPLFQLDLTDQPTWIQESYSQLKVKIQFIQLILYFYRYNQRDSVVVKDSLFKRFHRDFMVLPEDQTELRYPCLL